MWDAAEKCRMKTNCYSSLNSVKREKKEIKKSSTKTPHAELANLQYMHDGVNEAATQPFGLVS